MRLASRMVLFDALGDGEEALSPASTASLRATSLMISLRGSLMV